MVGAPGRCTATGQARISAAAPGASPIPAATTAAASVVSPAAAAVPTAAAAVLPTARSTGTTAALRAVVVIAEAVARSDDRRVIVAVAVIGGLALVGGLWFSGFFGGSGSALDVRQAEAGVKQILSDPINGYGANDVSAVKCNNGENPTIEAGKSFSCDVTINGAKRKVQVVFRDDAGTYEVDGPR